jgi:hypothetical protein
MNSSESLSAIQNQGIVERWLAEIRKRMPEGSFVTATVQMKPHRGFLASFRLRTDEETLSSEARADNPDEAVAQAGRGLCQHLPALSELTGFGGVNEDEFPRAG